MAKDCRSTWAIHNSLKFDYFSNVFHLHFVTHGLLGQPNIKKIVYVKKKILSSSFGF